MHIILFSSQQFSIVLWNSSFTIFNHCIDLFFVSLPRVYYHFLLKTPFFSLIEPLFFIWKWISEDIFKFWNLNHYSYVGIVNRILTKNHLLGTYSTPSPYQQVASIGWRIPTRLLTTSRTHILDNEQRQKLQRHAQSSSILFQWWHYSS
jgi:hypothetical protein